MGLDWHDFGARPYYTPLAAWLHPDALAGDYTWLSPYCYCANNPVNIIDPTGNKAIYVGSDSVIVKQSIDDLKGSPLFSHIYDKIDDHKNTIKINLVYDRNAKLGGSVDPNTGDITLYGGENGCCPDSRTIAEEVYHAYQVLYPATDDKDNNFEFEAKTVATKIVYEVGNGILVGGNPFNKDILRTTILNMTISEEDSNLMKALVSESKFKRTYIRDGNRFANYREYRNESRYKVKVRHVPSRLLELFKMFYLK